MRRPWRGCRCACTAHECVSYASARDDASKSEFDRSDERERDGCPRTASDRMREECQLRPGTIHSMCAAARSARARRSPRSSVRVCACDGHRSACCFVRISFAALGSQCTEPVRPSPSVQPRKPSDPSTEHANRNHTELRTNLFSLFLWRDA